MELCSVANTTGEISLLEGRDDFVELLDGLDDRIQKLVDPGRESFEEPLVPGGVDAAV
jgi:hypothetical protein